MNFAVLVREINIKFQRCLAVAASLESKRRKRRKVSVKGHLLRIIDQMCVCSVASVVSDSLQPYRLQPSRLRRAWDSPGRILERVLQGTFLTQGSNVSCLLHWQVGSLPTSAIWEAYSYLIEMSSLNYYRIFHWQKKYIQVKTERKDFQRSAVPIQSKSICSA